MQFMTITMVEGDPKVEFFRVLEDAQRHHMNMMVNHKPCDLYVRTRRGYEKV